MQRCSWVNDDPLYQQYHDNEWGVVQKNSLKIFEQLCLEAMQSGLSWYIVLKKRENYRQLFYQFDPQKIAELTEDDIDNLMLNEGIIRHRAKITAIIANARAYINYEQQHGKDSFSDFIWQFTNHQQIQQYEMITANDMSRQLAKSLKQLGFKFVGPTTVYAFMQAIGMYNSHELQCERR